jgi:hypothetical protein
MNGQDFPSPRLPPVTKATFPSNLNKSGAGVILFPPYKRLKGDGKPGEPDKKL